MRLGFLWWVLIGAVLIALVGVSQAVAHEAITGWTYPNSCCSARDCYQMEPGDVTWTPDGYRIEATGEVVPFERTRRSPDGFFHRCSSRGNPSKPTIGKTFQKGRCLWVPEAGT